MGASNSSTIANNYIDFHNITSLKEELIDDVLDNMQDKALTIVNENMTQATQATQATDSEEVDLTKYYYDDNNYFQVQTTNKNINIHLKKEDNTQFKRKALFRYIAFILNDICFLNKSVYLILDKPISINTLLAVAACNYFLKIKQNFKDEMHFEILQEPINIEDDAERCQFRVILKNDKFLMSQYNVQQNTFEFRDQTSYRYKEALYLHKNKLLDFKQCTQERLSFLKSLKAEREAFIIVKYKFQNEIYYFVGHPDNLLNKIHALTPQQQKVFMNKTFIHDFIFQKKSYINKILKKQQIIKPFNEDVFKSSSELVLRNIIMLISILCKNRLYKKIDGVISNYQLINQFITIEEALVIILQDTAEKLYLK